MRPWAEEAFAFYKASMKQLMLRFGLKTEGEVILGLTSQLPDDLMVGGLCLGVASY